MKIKYKTKINFSMPFSSGYFTEYFEGDSEEDVLYNLSSFIKENSGGIFNFSFFPICAFPCFEESELNRDTKWSQDKYYEN